MSVNQETSQAADTTVETVPIATIRKAVAAASIGNFAEWYDFALYGYVAGALAMNFFPSEDPTASLLAALATFAVAFVVRPFGGVLFGALGDKIGRRTTLAVVVLMMSGSTAAMGLLPTFDAIGVGAPILLLLCRTLQGLSAGGEYGGATALIAEYAPAHQRGRYAGFPVASTALAYVFAAGVIGACALFMPPGAFEAWGWRIPFLIAVPIGFVGLYLRLRVDDTPAFKALNKAEVKEHSPLGDTLRSHWKRILLLAGFISAQALGFFFLVSFVPTTLRATGELSQTAVTWSNACAMVVLGGLVFVFGWMQDRVGRKPLMFLAVTLIFALVVPSLLLITSGQLALVIIGQLLFAVPIAAVQASVAILLPEMFPTKSRFTAASISYNLASMVFGGTAAYVGTWLLSATDSVLSVGAYVMVVAVLALACAIRLPETLGKKLSEREVVAGR